MVRRLVKPGGRLREFGKIQAERGVLLPLLKENMLAEFGPDIDRRADLMHPSDMAHGDWCPRAEYYKLTGVPMPDEKFNYVLENIFEEGNEVQYKWQRRMRATHKLFGRWLCELCGADELGLEPGLIGCRNSHGHMWKYDEVPLVDEAHMIGGSADGAIDDYLVEIKTVGVGTVRVDAPRLLARYQVTTTEGDKLYDLDKLWKELRRPFTSHVKQGQWYLWLARERGLPFTTMRFLYEFKPNQLTKEFSIELSDSIMKVQLANAEMVHYAVETGVPPDCVGCKVCPLLEVGMKRQRRTVRQHA